MTTPGTSLNGKTALVTGGNRSLGRDIALKIAEAGADVVITYRGGEDAAKQTAADIEALGRRAAVLQADLTGTSQIEGLVKGLTGVLANWKADGLDILVNNAGISSHGTFGSITEEQVDEVYNINYKSVLFLTQALLPTLRDNGRVISIGSGLGRFSLPGIGVYGSFKAAVEHLMRYLARELGPRGITANAVAPGALYTDFNRQAFDQNPQMVDFIGSVTALGRVGKADDVGGVVAFLCSDDAHWITGQRIEVSGGMFL
jgi:NAD(P)-dependent dehydrogenase (short-subunit alcohol dehydrogenase family)